MARLYPSEATSETGREDRRLREAVRVKKFRVDRLLVEQGLCSSRERARALVMAGQVFANQQKVVKPADVFPADVELEVRGQRHPFVSRGGLKLARALEFFDLKVEGLRALDIGASTGGFTDCLLQRGALHVTAVDVGKGQLDWKLRQDSRVSVLESTNARYLSAEQVAEPVGFVCIDVAFISLGLIFPAVAPLLVEGGHLVALIKPQFEAGREQVGKKGVVRDPAVHQQVIEATCVRAHEAGLSVLGLTHSPIRGPAGNIEFLGGFVRAQCKGRPAGVDAAEVVRLAHESFCT